jgi:hypothetical protein
VQQQVIEDIFPLLEQAGSNRHGARGPEDAGLLTEWKQALANAARTVLQLVRDTANQTIRSIAQQQQEQRQETSAWIQGVAEELRAGASKLSETLAETSMLVAESHRQILTAAKSFSEGASGQRDQFARLLLEHQTAMAGAQKAVVDAAAKQVMLATDSTSGIAKIAQSTEALLKVHHATLQAVEKLSSSEALASIASLTQTMQSQIQQTRQVADALGMLSDGTKALVDSHAKLQTATQQLQDVGLGKALVSVRESLNAVVPVLQNFSKPFVLRAVPAGDNGD